MNAYGGNGGVADVLLRDLSISSKHFKDLFVASYFHMTDDYFLMNMSHSYASFVRNYLLNNFDVLDANTLLKYLNYLSEIKLRNVVIDRSIAMFKFVKPQFKFVCQHNNLNILKFDDKVYVRPGIPIYATNLFVNEPGAFRLIMYREFSKVYSDRNFVSNSDTHCLLDGSDGYVFESAYLDWCGVRMCHEVKTNYAAPSHPYRLYLVGEAMAKHFIENHIRFSDLGKDSYILRNFYKGSPLYKMNLKIGNSKKFVTRKPNQLFEELRTELDTHSTHIKFIQRDYIYDADFPEDVLDVLDNYMTETSVYKFITKFNEPGERNERGAHNEIVVDRYAVNRYCKLYVRIGVNDKFPSLRYNDPSYIMVRPDTIQIKGTLNAFYVPNGRSFAILANNSLIGSTVMLEFSLSLIPYAHNSPPRRLQADTFVVDKTQKLYLTKIVFGDTVPAYLLIRGDYESSFRSLNELKNTWVLNTLIKLLITPDIVARSLDIVNYNLRGV
ncbi:early 49 kDa protein [Orgyia leucostigma nucleopolyhedrovirus]|uniref:Early 49 kDa protein n=1 Tax=Orgyia leucostigma nucleopolyhedrovirus TaxID=490711 RepID=B0FDN0_9ABAC|nr:early 49 kDa protein [Orgyia leucostigma nucleopolyhedrovirus]ABY65738.1 early 49 kDa protein [Orgyia leucostigma nucleopolyhedrovirus]